MMDVVVRKKGGLQKPKPQQPVPDYAYPSQSTRIQEHRYTATVYRGRRAGNSLFARGRAWFDGDAVRLTAAGAAQWARMRAR